MPWPRIVSEALRRIDGRPALAGRGPQGAPLATVLDAIAAAQSPPRWTGVPPAFLRREQHDSWRRAMAALEIAGGALLLEPVGSGKTWIALAVAASQPGPVVAVVPAILRAQWSDAAARAMVPLDLWTHERASRGVPPRGRPSLVIIDEAHRLRSPATRRVRTLAPWLVGRRILLLTATPIVNRITDLIALLRLALPDDALTLDGVGRLDELESLPRPPAGLRRVAIRSQASATATIDRRVGLLRPDASEESRAAAAVIAIGQLELSTCEGTRRLLRSVLLDAAASSDAAFHQALKRYRALLLQSRDAGGASRAMLRRFAGESLDQLIFWPLLASEPHAIEMPLADIAPVELLLARSADDVGWIGSLVARCDDTRTTICFTRHRATARRLRMELGDSTAWITGSEAGIGPHRIARAAVLAAFGIGRTMWRVRRALPRILVATDVAAEGLDLQSAGRIVHVDLPWTATRIEQREGRLLRIGQEHQHVEVLVRLPGSAIERAFAPRARVRLKRRLADEWLRALEVGDRDPATCSADPVVACVHDTGATADLVAVAMQRDGSSGVVVMCRHGNEPWSVDDTLAAALIDRARSGLRGSIAVAGADITLVEAAAAAMGRQIGVATPLALVRRIHGLARQAARARDVAALRRLDRLLRFATTPTTLGGRTILTESMDLADAEFIRQDVPDVLRRGTVTAIPIAALLFRCANDR